MVKSIGPTSRKGLPIFPAQQLLYGHTNNNKLCSKHNNKLTKPINNIGVFQGTPLSANIFIIYADREMKSYTGETRNLINTNGEVRIRNDNIENKYAEFLLNNNYNYEHIENTHEAQRKNKMGGRNDRSFSLSNCDRLIYDDANISFRNRNEIPIKLNNYNDASGPNNFQVNRNKVSILTSKKVPNSYNTKMEGPLII